MRIHVRVVPNAKMQEVTKVGENDYRIRVNAPAIEGRANARLIEIIAEHFNANRSRIRIVDGARSRNKTIDIA